MKTSHIFHRLAGLPGRRTGGVALFMTTVLLVCLLLATPVVQLSAVDGDWGVTLDTEGTARVTNDDWDDPDTTLAFTAALWGRLFLSDPATPGSNSYELAAQGSYTWTDDRPYLFDVDQLRLTGRYPGLLGSQSLLEASAGRFRFADPTARVMSHTADGARLRLRFPSYNIRLDAAYTGLQLNPNSDIRMTFADLVDEDDDDEFFGPARVVGIAELAFPGLIGQHSLQLGVTGQYDLRDTKDTETTFNSGYYTVALSGPLVSDIYYNTSATLMQAEEENGDSEDFLGLLAIARLRYFRESFLFSRATLAGIYASGEQGPFDPFRSISRQSMGTVFSRPLSDLIYGELGYSLRPFSGSDARSSSSLAGGIQTGLTLRSFFAATDPGLDGTDGRWYGNELTLSISSRPFADLGIGLTAGVFLPVTDEDLGVLGKDSDPQYFGKLELSAAF